MNILERFASNIKNKRWLIRLENLNISGEIRNLRFLIFWVFRLSTIFVIFIFIFKSLFGYSNKVKINIISVIGNDSFHGNDTLFIILLFVYDIVHL